MQESSSGLALQACLRHSHQALKSFSVIALSYVKMRGEPALGQVPLATIYAPLFCSASTFPHAFSWLPLRACLHSVLLTTAAHLSPECTTMCVLDPVLFLFQNTKENIETATTEHVVLPILSRKEAILLLWDVPLSGPAVGASFPPTDGVQPSSCWVVQPLAPVSAGSNNQTGISGPKPPY